jgi:CHRD domain-containing protein
MTETPWFRIRLAVAAIVSLALVVAPTARAQVTFQATLTPAADATDSTGHGMGTFVFNDETKMLSYDITITSPLTGPVIAAHIHDAATTGILVPLDTSLHGTADLSTLSDFTGFVSKLFAGQTYANLHTPAHPNGEINGTLMIVQGTAACSCSGAANHGQFVKCVKQAIHKLDKSERKDARIKALMRDAARSACGKKKVGRKSIACCLPANPEGNIVNDALCLPVSETKCGAAGGTSRGAGTSCLTAACSPSGAFLDP